MRTQCLIVIFLLAVTTSSASNAAALVSCHDARGLGQKLDDQATHPDTPRTSGAEAKTLLHVFVNAQGYPEIVRVRKSSGHVKLDQMAVDTVQAWCFTAAKKTGKSIDAWVLVPVSLQLDSNSTITTEDKP